MIINQILSYPDPKIVGKLIRVSYSVRIHTVTDQAALRRPLSATSLSQSSSLKHEETALNEIHVVR